MLGPGSTKDCPGYFIRPGDTSKTRFNNWNPFDSGVIAAVRGYDDGGHGIPIEGATVSAGGQMGVTGADGRVQLVLPAGTYRLVARKDGLVRSFAERVEVP